MDKYYNLIGYYSSSANHMHSEGRIVNSINGWAIVILVILAIISFVLYIMQDNRLGCLIGLNHGQLKIAPSKIKKYFKRMLWALGAFGVIVVIATTISGILVHKQHYNYDQASYYHYKLENLQYRKDAKSHFDKKGIIKEVNRTQKKMDQLRK